MSTARDETVSCCFFIWELLRIGKFQRKFEGIFLSISFECNLQRHCSGMILWNDFYCLWESLSCSFLWMEMAPKSSFQHLASLSWDQLTSKVLKLYVCRCEGAVVTFICASEGRVWVCPHLLTGDVLLCDFCVCVCLYRKGQKLEPSEKYMFNRMEGGRSMLTIRNIRQNDGGSYTCKASNKAGSQERELFLKVFGKVNGKCCNKVDY